MQRISIQRYKVCSSVKNNECGDLNGEGISDIVAARLPIAVAARSEP
jgi:hypothetical protein